ncbi:oleate hydratase, partial [Staphylococcus sp. GDY8P40P]|uniref:oleate hydratase n=1 Tax=Staphylococcus sp. GDY8P40P TaxID=2804419 RepID=UPI00194FF9DE
QNKSLLLYATTTTNYKKVISYIEKLSKRDVLSGLTVIGGIVTVADSSWQLSFTVNSKQLFKEQTNNQFSILIYAL